MARKPSARIICTVTEPLWRRDLLEMRAVDALVTTFGSKPQSPKRATAKPPTAPKKNRR